MMKSINKPKTLLSIIFFFFCFFMVQKAIEVSLANQEQNENKTKEQLNSDSSIDKTVIVAKIGEYTINKQDLEKRLFSELQPNPYKIYTSDMMPPDANTVLTQMIAEKAIIMEARKQGLCEEEDFQKTIKDYTEKQIVNTWISDNLKTILNEISVTEAEIEQLIKDNPDIDHQKAKSFIEESKANKLMDQRYLEIYRKFEVKKIKENFPKAIALHDKLLNHPKEPQRMKYIRIKQITEELTEKEQNLVLATFAHGTITFKNWLETLCELSPPSRPNNLNTEKGFEQFLEKTLVKPIILAEAKILGLDKDPSLLKRIRDREDSVLYSRVSGIKYEEITEPNAEDIIAFYNKNKDYFANNLLLKIDQIWCSDFETATQIKAELDEGKDFEQAKEEYSIYKESQTFNASPGNQGYFWNYLQASEPNQIIGPIKGFRTEEIKWRIVKILDKVTSQREEYSSEYDDDIRMLIMSQQSQKELTDYGLELLNKYPHEIYRDKIKDIDPLNIK